MKGERKNSLNRQINTVTESYIDDKLLEIQDRLDALPEAETVTLEAAQEIGREHNSRLWQKILPKTKSDVELYNFLKVRLFYDGERITFVNGEEIDLTHNGEKKTDR